VEGKRKSVGSVSSILPAVVDPVTPATVAHEDRERDGKRVKTSTQPNTADN
jgi:hypothetical protein